MDKFQLPVKEKVNLFGPKEPKQTAPATSASGAPKVLSPAEFEALEKQGLVRRAEPREVQNPNSSGLLGSIFGGDKIGEAIGTSKVRGDASKGKGVVEAEYDKLSPAAIARLQAKGVPINAQDQRDEIVESIEGPTKMQLLGDAARVATNFIPGGTLAKGAQTAFKSIPIASRFAKGLGNLSAGLGTGYAFDVSNNLAEGNENAFTPGAGTLIGGSLPLVGSAFRGVGNVAAETLGLTTGEGAGSLRKLTDISREGGEAANLMRQGLRGNLDQEEIAKDAFGALSKVSDNRRINYSTDLGNLKQSTQEIDAAPLMDSFKKQLEKFNVTADAGGKLDFSRSPGLGRYAKDIENLQEILNKWGSKEGDNTIAGTDKLKQIIDDFKIGTPDSKRLDSFMEALRKDAKDLITTQVDEPTKKTYEKMLADYQEASKEINDAQKLLALGGKNNADQAWQRLSKVFRGNSEMKQRLLEELNEASGGTLIPKIVGTQFNNAAPGFIRSLVGGMAAYGGSSGGQALLPIFAALTAFSPRVVGELANLLGLGLRGKDVLMKLLVGQGSNKNIMPGDVLLNKGVPFMPNRKSVPTNRYNLEAIGDTPADQGINAAREDALRRSGQDDLSSMFPIEDFKTQQELIEALRDPSHPRHKAAIIKLNEGNRFNK